MDKDKHFVYRLRIFKVQRLVHTSEMWLLKYMYFEIQIA